MVHIFLSLPYIYLIINSVNFNEKLRIFCTFSKISINTVFTIEVIEFKHSKFGQILCVDKTCFLRPGHIYLEEETRVKFYINMYIHVCLLA